MGTMTKTTVMKIYCKFSEGMQHPALPAIASTRLTGRWLSLVRLAWIGIVLLTLSLFVMAIPIRYAELQRTCLPGTCNELQLFPADGTALAHLGISLQAYATYNILFEAVLPFGCLLVALLIFWNSADDWMALFASLTLVVFGATLPPVVAALGRAQPQALPATLFVQELASFCMGTLLYLFPNGRFVSRWSILPVLAWGLWSVVRPLFMHTTPFALGQIENIALIGFFAIGGIAQIYRYVRVSNAAQRQQTRWVVFGLTTLVVGIFLYVLLHLIFSQLTQPGLAHILGNLITIPLCLTFPGLLVPLTLGIAILRFQLWDIDIIIKRTLVYTPLTVVLALIYVALVIVLQFSVSWLIGSNYNNDITIVVSTVIIAALFQPLRRSLQKDIDRRFYRSKYNASKTLEAFSATLGSEIDLTQLSEQLVAIVQTTMQPTEVSLWLCQREYDEGTKTRVLPDLGNE